MKRFAVMLIVSAMAATAVLLTGCEWSSGGSSNGFNTSRGAGVNINWTGVYNGNLGGGKAVANTTGSPVTRLTITQAGNTIQVTDNNGSRYDGTVGAPGAVSEPLADGSYSVGAELASSQISFSGDDYSAGKRVEFVGVLHAVAVDEIQGTTTEDTVQDSSVDSDVDVDTTTRTQTIVDEDNNTTTVITIIDDGDTQTTITTVTRTDTGEQISRTVSTSDISGQETEAIRTTTTITTFLITEANTQYRLEGTWIEEGGAISGVDALSRGASSTITTEATARTPVLTPTDIDVSVDTGGGDTGGDGGGGN